MARTKTTVYNNIAGLNQALRRLTPEISAKMRDASQDIAGDIASKAATRARSVGGAAALVAPSIRAKRDRVPIVQMGGTKHIRPGANQTIGNVIWGAEWGSDQYTQFRRREQHGYFLWRTVHDMSDQMMKVWSDALGDALRDI